MSESSVAIAAAAALSGGIDHIDLDSHYNLEPDPSMGAPMFNGVTLPADIPGHGAELKKEFYAILKKYKFDKGHLLDGKAKDIYLFQLNDKSKVRHLDILYVPEEEKYFQILYFSSSSEFSKKIRLIASKKGYKLNEKGLFDKKTGKKIKLEPTSEKDIFEYLNIPFVKQENRNK